MHTSGEEDRVASALDAAGILWVRLRDGDGGSGGDIDVLIAADGVAAVAASLRRAGFVRRPAPGRAPHHFWIHYAEADDRWTKLDVVTGLAFGRYGELVVPPGVVAAGLAARTIDVGYPRLEPSDAFWALLLHVLLDRATVRPDRDVELRLAAGGATSPGPLAEWLGAVLPPGRPPDAVVADVATGGIVAAVDLGPDLVRRWRARSPGATRLRAARARVVRTLARRVGLGAPTGMTLAVLGPDGAGKSTLLARLDAGPLPVRTWYLGLYGAAGRGVRGGMAGRIARSWRRWLAARLHAARGGVAVFDRYTYDARLAARRGGPRAALRRRILARALPRPDLTIVLDAPAEVLHARKAEHPEAVLDEQRRRYRALAASLANAEVIDVTGDVETVRRAVTTRIWRRLAAQDAAR